MPHQLTHPDSNQKIEVEADQVPNYQSQGWEKVRTARPRQSTPRAPKAPKAKADAKSAPEKGADQ